MEPEQLRACAESIGRNAWRCAHIAAALRTYVQSVPSPVAPHALSALVRDALLRLGANLQPPTGPPLAIQLELPPDLPPLECDGPQLIQALINLLTNARDAMPQGGQLTLRASYSAEFFQFQLQVQDTGTGIPEALQGRIFDPFFTTKPIGQGIGLGLAVVAGIVKAHHGQIAVHSAPGQGSTFTLVLPEKAPPAAPAPARLRETGGRFDDAVLPRGAACCAPTAPGLARPVRARTSGVESKGREGDIISPDLF